MKDNSIGEIISAGTFTHGNDGPDALDELLRIVKPEGLFVLSINSKFFIKAGFKKNFLKLIIEYLPPLFEKISAHCKNINKTHNEVEIFACIFRKKL